MICLRIPANSKDLNMLPAIVKCAGPQNQTLKED
jgi:hypothetical protein